MLQAILGQCITGDSKTMLWRKEKKRIELEKYVKRIKKIDTFFNLASENIGLSKSTPININTDLYIYLKKLNQLCLIGKSKKKNHDIFIYDYVCLLSVCQFI